MEYLRGSIESFEKLQKTVFDGIFFPMDDGSEQQRERKEPCDSPLVQLDETGEKIRPNPRSVVLIWRKISDNRPIDEDNSGELSDSLDHDNHECSSDSDSDSSSRSGFGKSGSDSDSSSASYNDKSDSEKSKKSSKSNAESDKSGSESGSNSEIEKESKLSIKQEKMSALEKDSEESDGDENGNIKIKDEKASTSEKESVNSADDGIKIKQEKSSGSDQESGSDYARKNVKDEKMSCSEQSDSDISIQNKGLGNKRSPKGKEDLDYIKHLWDENPEEVGSRRSVWSRKEPERYNVGECYDGFNNETTEDWPLCSVQMTSVMLAANDSDTCMYRNKLVSNLNEDLDGSSWNFGSYFLPFWKYGSPLTQSFCDDSVSAADESFKTETNSSQAKVVPEEPAEYPVVHRLSCFKNETLQDLLSVAEQNYWRRNNQLF